MGSMVGFFVCCFILFCFDEPERCSSSSQLKHSERCRESYTVLASVVSREAMKIYTSAKIICIDLKEKIGVCLQRLQVTQGKIQMRTVLIVHAGIKLEGGSWQ